MLDTMWGPPGEHISRSWKIGVHVRVVGAEWVKGDRVWPCVGFARLWFECEPQVLSRTAKPLAFRGKASGQWAGLQKHRCPSRGTWRRGSSAICQVQAQWVCSLGPRRGVLSRCPCHLELRLWATSVCPNFPRFSNPPVGSSSAQSE